MWKYEKDNTGPEKVEPGIARPVIAAVLSATMTVGIAALAITPIQDAARAEGYSEGYGVGWDKGYKAGYDNATDNAPDKSANSTSGTTSFTDRLLNELEQQRKSDATSGDSTMQNPSYAEQPLPANGTLLKIPDAERICPLTVEVLGGKAYYVYLDSLYFPSDDMSFVIRPNSTVDLDVPIGQYEIYYATGETWYGPQHKFGDETRFYKCDGSFRFYDDGEHYQGWTLELYMQSNGNMDTDEIDASEFPG